MAQKKIKDATRRYEGYVKEQQGARYMLRLYVTGATPASTRAITNLKRLCEEHLQGRYELEVIDIFQQAKLAGGDQIVAAPTLIKALPLPLRRFVGDLSNTEGVLLGLDLLPVKRGCLTPH